MYSTYNEVKSVVAERFNKTLKNNIFKHMAAVSKKIYFAVLDNIVEDYNKLSLRTIKMESIDVKPDSYAEWNVDSNEKDPKFEIGYHVRISIYKNIFAKGSTPNYSKEVFVISKIKDKFSWTLL